MSFVTVANENTTAIDLYYEDHGVGQPVVLIHGFPLSGASWEKQLPELLEAGFRVITYDRRGFGRSSQPSSGYDYDTFASDLNTLLTHLDLNDVILVGFSMGGGEVARYIGRYGTARVSKAVFIAAIPPYLRKAEDNPDAADPAVFEGIKAQIRQDRPSFLAGFFQNFFNADVLKGERITEEALQMSWGVAVSASPIATYECVDTWGTDFRADLSKVDVPTLVIHGDADRIVPLELSGAKTAAAIAGAEKVVVPGGPHAVNWTHADVVNPVLLNFLKK